MRCTHLVLLGMIRNVFSVTRITFQKVAMKLRTLRTVSIIDCVNKKARRALGKWAYLSKETNAKILSEVLQEKKNATLQSLSEHSKECHILDGELRNNHITKIVKLIFKNYLILLHHQFGKVFT